MNRFLWRHGTVLIYYTIFVLGRTWAFSPHRVYEKSFGSIILHPRSSSSLTSVDDHQREVQPARHPKQPQVRKKPRNRRPRNYWTHLPNMEREFRDQWKSCGVTLPMAEPPPIPSETLLNYWERHDMRAAIVTHGGRHLLSESLGNAPIIPGKWKEAVKTPWLKKLLQQDASLTAEAPPLSKQQRKKLKRENSDNSTNPKKETNTERRWYHSEKRRPWRYWSSTKIVVKELYAFLAQRRQQENIPEVWMPRMSDFSHAGRDDLAQAIRRFGGPTEISRIAGLVPFQEWNYIEGMYELLLALKEYLDEYAHGDCSTFPVASHIQERGKDRLYSLIQYYGGAKFISARLNMNYSGLLRNRSRDQLISADMNWGPFDLEFGIALYAFVREQQLQMKPPLSHPEILIPSQLDLLRHQEHGLLLDKKIQEYGGYESVARRLGLGISFQYKF